jgi:hypothetical protein
MLSVPFALVGGLMADVAAGLQLIERLQSDSSHWQALFRNPAWC